MKCIAEAKNSSLKYMRAKVNLINDFKYDVLTLNSQHSDIILVTIGFYAVLPFFSSDMEVICYCNSKKKKVYYKAR